MVTDLVHVAALGVLLQVAFMLLANRRQREELQTTAPITCFLVLGHGAMAAAVQAGVVHINQLMLVEELLWAEPWRMLSCVLVYERALPLATHLWLLIKLGRQLEPKLGSRDYASLLAFSCAASLGLRYAMLPPAQRPALLTAAPLFSTVLIWAQHAGPAAAATSPGSVRARLTARLPWVLLGGIAMTEGAFAALPGLLGVGAGALYEAVVGLPPPKPKSAAESAAAAGNATGAASGEATAGGDVAKAADAPTNDTANAPPPAAQPRPQPPSRFARGLQFLAGAYLLASMGLVDLGDAGKTEANRVQCEMFATALDLTEPLTAQLVSNYTADRAELVPDYEAALRAFEWLVVRWERPDEASRAQLAAEAAAAGPAALAAARQALYESQLRREVKQVVEQWLPTLEINSAQDDSEVLDILLKQLGYRPSLAGEVQAAWLGGIETWRSKKTIDERNLAALRAYVEMGSLDSVADDLPDELAKPIDLINATLGQFEVPNEMTRPTVLKEILKELDMDVEDVADGAQAILTAGIDMHLAHRISSSREQLDQTLGELRTILEPAITAGGDAQRLVGGGVLRRADRLEVERVVGRALTQLPGVLGSNEEALHGLLTALNLSDPSNTTAPAKGGPKLTEASPSLVRLLRGATDTHCDGLRRQEAREVAIRKLQKLLMAEVIDDPVPLPDDDEGDDEEGEANAEGEEAKPKRGRKAAAADKDEGGSNEGGAAAESAGEATDDKIVANWSEGGELVGLVYGGFEEQAREMTMVELMLDILRMAQLAEDEIRKGDRSELERSIKEFQSSLDNIASAAVPASSSFGGGEGGSMRDAGWRPMELGEWGKERVSHILREGGGDGSDFALAVAVLAHSLGTRVRVNLICLPASVAAAAAAAAAPEGETADDAAKQRQCRLVTEARVGFHPSGAAAWVHDRHAAGLGALGKEAPQLHFRREDDGSTWLSLALGAESTSELLQLSEQQPGGAYLPPLAAGKLSTPADVEYAEWTTFYPTDEHGCRWHVRGDEGDSTRRVHGSPAPQSIAAQPAEEDTALP